MWRISKGKFTSLVTISVLLVSLLLGLVGCAKQGISKDDIINAVGESQFDDMFDSIEYDKGTNTASFVITDDSELIGLVLSAYALSDFSEGFGMEPDADTLSAVQEQWDQYKNSMVYATKSLKDHLCEKTNSDLTVEITVNNTENGKILTVKDDVITYDKIDELTK